jgi:hypothetical protein
MPEDQVWADIVAPRLPTEVIDTDDVVAAAERTQGRIALVDGPEDVLDLLAKPIALWRVFLHPSQEKVAPTDPRIGAVRRSPVAQERARPSSPCTGVKHLIASRTS